MSSIHVSSRELFTLVHTNGDECVTVQDVIQVMKKEKFDPESERKVESLVFFRGSGYAWTSCVRVRIHVLNSVMCQC